ncbi:hypothetical protein ABTM28_21175, partial [Acinetobacter baumannii]
GLGVLLEIDRNKARQLAKRALDVLGPRSAEVRARLLEHATRASDPALAIAVRERWLAVEPTAEGAPEVLLELAKLRGDAG